MIGKVRYRGTDIGFDGLVDGRIYDVEWAEGGNYGDIDESSESYVYNARIPCNCMAEYAEIERGVFEIVEDPMGILKKQLDICDAGQAWGVNLR